MSRGLSGKLWTLAPAAEAPAVRLLSLPISSSNLSWISSGDTRRQASRCMSSEIVITPQQRQVHRIVTSCLHRYACRAPDAGPSYRRLQAHPFAHQSSCLYHPPLAPLSAARAYCPSCTATASSAVAQWRGSSCTSPYAPTSMRPSACHPPLV